MYLHTKNEKTAEILPADEPAPTDVELPADKKETEEVEVQAEKVEDAEQAPLRKKKS